MLIIKYETEEEAERIIAEKNAQGFRLSEIANITEGNFLGFDDSEVKQREIDELKIVVADLAEIVMGGQ